MNRNKLERMFDEIIKNKYDNNLYDYINNIYCDFYNDNILSYKDIIVFFEVIKDIEGNIKDTDYKKAYNNFHYKEITDIDVDECEIIKIPPFVKQISPTKFINFKSLKRLVIDNNNSYLSQSHNTLSKICLDSNNSSIYSFSNALKEVTISNSVNRIDNSAFEHCVNLETVAFKKKLSNDNKLIAGSRVFSGCYRLKRANIQNLDFLDNYVCDNYSCPFMYGAKAYINGKEVTLNCKKHSKCFGCDIGLCVQNKVGINNNNGNTNFALSSSNKINEIINYIDKYKHKINSSLKQDTSNYESVPRYSLSFISADKVKNDLSKSHEVFSEVINRKLKEKNLTEPECYKKANISKGTFNKIINNNVKPKKENVALISISLGLDSKEYDEFISSAGYARSNDINDPLNIVGYFIDHDEFDMDEIEDAVYEITGKHLAYYGE